MCEQSECKLSVKQSDSLDINTLSMKAEYDKMK